MAFVSNLTDKLVKVLGYTRTKETPIEPRTSQPDSFSDADAYIDPTRNGALSEPEVAMLKRFRLLAGITSMNAVHRPAPNLGLYARIVHNEKTAKVGYQRSSILINGCLGAQIIVAAALTAMGAAGANRSAVTVFGAINTVIAGILTFLKGSGLPSRLKYYQNEWKKVREYIEQRERDFSRPGCDQDPYAVVAIIEAMYEEVKLDTEANTPDRFAGGGNQRAMLSMRPAESGSVNPEVKPGFAQQIQRASTGFSSRSKDLEAGFGTGIHDVRRTFSDREKQLEAGFGTKIHDSETAFRNKEKDMEEGLVKGFQHAETTLGDKLHETHSGLGQKMKELEMFGNRLKDIASDIGHRARDSTHDIETQERRVASHPAAGPEHPEERGQ